MNLSSDSVKLLRWMNQHDKWMYLREIEQGYRNYSFRSFHALQAAKLVDSTLFEDEVPVFDEYGNLEYDYHFRIADTGKAYLEGLKTVWLPELREWIAVAISVVALVVSVIALIS